MLRPILRLLALSTVSLGVAGSLMALPASTSTFKLVPPVAKAVLSPVPDDPGVWMLIATGPVGTSATVSWIADGDIQVVMTATVGPEGSSSCVRFAAASGTLFDLALSAPGYSRKVLADIGPAGATLTVGLSNQQRTNGGSR